MPGIRIVVFSIALALLVPFPAYSRSLEDARITLGKMNIPYTADAFVKAAGQGDNVVVKLFLDAGMRIDTPDKSSWTALMGAVNGGHTDTVKVLLDKGADVNAKRYSGATALMMAASGSHIDIVKILLEKGADVNVKLKNGWTALMFARGHTEIVELLKKAGAKE